jgi:hypothetical protein
LAETEKFTWELDREKYLEKSQCEIFIDDAKEYLIGANKLYKEFKSFIDEHTPSVFKEGLFS